MERQAASLQFVHRGTARATGFSGKLIFPPCTPYRNGLPWVLGGLAAAAVLAAGHTAIVSGAAAQAKAYLATSALAKSGFFAAFSLIFLSELGEAGWCYLLA